MTAFDGCEATAIDVPNYVVDPEKEGREHNLGATSEIASNGNSKTSVTCETKTNVHRSHDVVVGEESGPTRHGLIRGRD